MGKSKEINKISENQLKLDLIIRISTRISKNLIIKNVKVDRKKPLATNWKSKGIIEKQQRIRQKQQEPEKICQKVEGRQQLKKIVENWNKLTKINKSSENRWKLKKNINAQVKIKGSQRKSKEISKNPKKSATIKRNQWESTVDRGIIKVETHI